MSLLQPPTPPVSEEASLDSKTLAHARDEARAYIDRLFGLLLEVF